MIKEVLAAAAKKVMPELNSEDDVVLAKVVAVAVTGFLVKRAVSAIYNRTKAEDCACHIIDTTAKESPDVKSDK